MRRGGGNAPVGPSGHHGYRVQQKEDVSRSVNARDIVQGAFDNQLERAASVRGCEAQIRVGSALQINVHLYRLEGLEAGTPDGETLFEKNLVVAVEIKEAAAAAEIDQFVAFDCQGGPGRIAGRALRTRNSRTARKSRMTRLAGVAG